eukprot:TRINITY_DN31502_c0_g2_i1.p1 TRINITY_DN31502_c0_g2~~TRINITY_DN31502_c0_g2_i1.p1  ORF type:complete len:240 (+),score=40.96 TRINITY_DN31502_c0_g2_i1:150-869(+)
MLRCAAPFNPNAFQVAVPGRLAMPGISQGHCQIALMPAIQQRAQQPVVAAPVFTPVAQPVKPTPQEVSGATPAVCRWRGTIKSFNKVSGYGFVSSPETQKWYGRDVFLQRKECKGLNVGDTVEFSVELSHAGMPQARDVQNVMHLTALAPDHLRRMAPQIPPHGVSRAFFGLPYDSHDSWLEGVSSEGLSNSPSESPVHSEVAAETPRRCDNDAAMGAPVNAETEADIDEDDLPPPLVD